MPSMLRAAIDRFTGDLAARDGTQNQKARDRCIYIHGTPEEHRIGKPASFGCIWMRSRDIIDLYDRVHIGTHVLITPHRIHDFVKPEQPDLLARSD